MKSFFTVRRCTGILGFLYIIGLAHLAVADIAVPASVAVPKGKVFFVSPKDGETVKQEFKVKMGEQGLSVVPAGTQKPGSGHHHIIVNGQPIAPGNVIPKDETHLHFGKAETETTMKLAPGKYTLTLQFADASHLSYGETLSQSIKITVK